jgi:hypothetical protein
MPGDFSAEAYEQLRAAYAKETNTQLDAEAEGVKILGQEMTLETLPVDSPWKSKIDNWTYPTGKSQYLDGKQDPAEVLAIMRGAAQEIDDAEKLEEAKELVAEAEAKEETESEEEEVETTAETEEVSDEDLGEMSDEEFEKFIDDILDGVSDDEELDEDEEEESVDTDTEGELSEEELDAILEETEDEDEEETKEEYDPQDVADEISRLKDELENMRFVSTAAPTEEPAEDDQNDESD